MDKKAILVVDDMEINRVILQNFLNEDYEIILAEDGLEALDVLDHDYTNIGCILLDLLMPNLDGYGVLEGMAKRSLIGKVPVIIITGERDIDTEQKCFDLGASDFITKPFNAMIVKRRVNNQVRLSNYQKDLQHQVEVKTEELRKQAEKLKETNVKIIDILGNVVESRNLESGEHVKRVRGFARILGMQLMKDFPEYGLTKSRVEMIAQASALHDVGKIAISDAVLLKPGRLTDEEFEIMKTHTTKGCDILDNIHGIWTDDYKKTSYEICRHHHERFDGRGYPDKLAGEDIPLSAQIVSVGDVYDALVSERCYKKPFSKEEAYDMITNNKCGVFNPKLMTAFANCREEFEALADENEKKVVLRENDVVIN